MKESMWGYWFIVLGLSIMSVMVLLQNYTTTNEQDYYLIKNVLEASMYESVDYAYFRDTSRIRMNTEKFVENFVRRFAETVSATNTYQIDFFDIYEAPPKASIKISTNTGNYLVANEQANFDVVNSIDIIVEYTDAIHKNPGDYEYKECDYYATG